MNGSMHDTDWESSYTILYKDYARLERRYYTALNLLLQLEDNVTELRNVLLGDSDE